MSTANRVATPLLTPGQRLSQAEFHERYEAMPPGLRAELIGGVVFMPSPVGSRHGIVDGNAGFWLKYYKSKTPGVVVYHNATAILDDLGELQPDAFLRIKSDRGGQSHEKGRFIDGATELVIEIAGSSRTIDLGPKLLDYERAGSLEYVVFTIDPDEVFWFVRQGDRLIRTQPGEDGLYRSTTIPGLWLDPTSLFEDDEPAIMATLDRGFADPAHAAFVARLADVRKVGEP